MQDSPRIKEKKGNLCVLGLGYVGLTLATVFAEEGYDVIGVDRNATIIDQLKNGLPHFYEPGLDERMNAVSKNLSFATKIPEITGPVVYIIAVGTNANADGSPDYSHIDGASNDIAAWLKKDDLVILRSTVTIGTTRARVLSVLEKGTGLSAGKDFFVSFAPERTIEGKALEELRTLPQMIAGYSRACRDRAEHFFRNVSEHVVLLDTLEEAELAKLISNSYRDLSFAFANAVALVASKHNVNVNAVIAGANEGYKRNNIPLPSPGVGGYCLTKDPLLLIHGMDADSGASQLMKSGRKVNSGMPAHVADLVARFAKKHYLKDSPHIVIAGLAFKGHPATSDVRHSPSEVLLRELRTRGFEKVSGYDPHVSPDVFSGWGIGMVEDLADLPKNADVVVLMHKSDHYLDLLPSHFMSETSKLIIDPWGVLLHNREEFETAGVAYANLGFRSFE